MTDAFQPGDWVLMHTGLVRGMLTEHEARDALGAAETGQQRSWMMNSLWWSS